MDASLCALKYVESRPFACVARPLPIRASSAPQRLARQISENLGPLRVEISVFSHLLQLVSQQASSAGESTLTVCTVPKYDSTFFLTPNQIRSQAVDHQPSNARQATRRTSPPHINNHHPQHAPSPAMQTSTAAPTRRDLSPQRPSPTAIPKPHAPQSRPALPAAPQKQRPPQLTKPFTTHEPTPTPSRLLNQSTNHDRTPRLRPRCHSAAQPATPGLPLPPPLPPTSRGEMIERWRRGVRHCSNGNNDNSSSNNTPNHPHRVHDPQHLSHPNRPNAHSHAAMLPDSGESSVHAARGEQPTWFYNRDYQMEYTIVSENGGGMYALF
ncbi:uncharacterized protein K452DRAFT_356510 [Aplosporella prunicola CBS 121167]|uniref:Uncharacterized protein n=1 Tax=Aplosporella prunicola CBS 121167 TaxID=1176127 RepID=A0A6A6BNH1_9PEZI|nr:uncharacterized protein K452DRAFT_356510 [Aplosporella prunicola CBS 121167]KAF2145218.1 hypothetical protein K452DRAFT_356510 [Aplosporella prunicola CBS 121167]